MLSPVIKSSPKHLVRIECTSFQGEYARVIPGWTNAEAALRLYQIADQIPSLHAIQPFLPTHGWLGYTGLFRFPVDLVTMREGLTVSAAYTAVFLALAVWRFRRRDITA